MSVAGHASKGRLPTIHELRRWPEQGALVSYGPDLHICFIVLRAMLIEYSMALSRLIYLLSSYNT